jgi:hypothetical protein
MNPDSAHLLNSIRKYKLDCRHPKELENIMKLLERDRMRPGLARRLIKKYQPWIKEQIIKGNYLPMPPTWEDLGLDEKPFDVYLGNCIERPEVPFGIHLSTGVHHILIFGKPLAGKTVALKVYIKKTVEYGLLNPDDKTLFIIFDSKNDLPNPKKILGDNVVHIDVRDPSKVRYGLNSPPGVPIFAWGANMSTVLAARLNLIVSRTCASAVYNWLVPLLNPKPLPAQPPTAPSLGLMLDVLTHSPPYCWGEKIDYIRTLVQMLHALVIDANGVMDAERGFEINQDVLLKGCHCVINVTNLEPAYLRYIYCDIIVLQILTYRIFNQLKTTKTKISLVFSEGDFFTLSSAQAVYPQHLSPLAVYGRIAREYGCQYIADVSSLQNIDPYLVTGAGYIMAMSTVDAESIREILRTLGYDYGIDKLLPALKPGQVIVREAQGPYPYPFLGQFEFIEPDHSQKSTPYDSIPFTEARHLKDLPAIQEALKKRIAEQKKTHLRQNKSKQVTKDLTDNERTFLDLMSLHEYDPLHIIFTRMGNLSPATQRSIIIKLIDKDLINYSLIRKSKSSLRVGNLTKSAWQFLNKQSKFKPLRGSDKHTAICRWKQRLDLKNGAEESICEFPIPETTGFSDIGSKFNGKIHCTEVIVDCTSNICHHTRDCFIKSRAIESLTIVTLLKSEHSQIRDTIMSDPELVFFINRIKFMTVDEILKGLWP